MKARTWVPLTVAASLLLTGCASLTPGTASMVGEERITVSEVDDLTDAQCQLTEQAVSSGQAQVAPLAQQKQAILGFLIETSLNEQFAADRDVSAPAPIRDFVVQQSSAGLDQLDAGLAAQITPVIERSAAGQADLAAVAADESGQPLTQQSLQQLLQQGLQLRQQWQRDLEIRTDSRYGPGADGLPGSGNGSVSQPSSEVAKQAQQAAGGQGSGYAAGLPPAQRCGG